MRFTLAVVATCVLSAAMADEAELSFNGDAARGGYVHQFQSSALRAEAGWLHHSDNGDVFHIGAHLSGQASAREDEVTAGLGVRLVYTDGDINDQDGAALPIGGYVNFTPQRYDRFSLRGHAYFSPDVLSFGDSEQYEEYGVRASYNLMRDADIFVGARYINGEYKTAPDAKFDTGMHVGISLRF